MEELTQLFGNLLAFVYHSFDRIAIHGYLSALSRPSWRYQRPLRALRASVGLHAWKMACNAARYPHPFWRAIRRIREEQKINQEETAAESRARLH